MRFAADQRDCEPAECRSVHALMVTGSVLAGSDGSCGVTSLVVSISTLDLNLMLVLHTVLTERNVARAAERLHVTPSAVSNSLARLRDVLHDPLVTRKGRGIVPTPRALELAPVLSRSIRDIEVAIQPTAFDAKHCARTFTLAVADLGQLIWVPTLVREIRREMPLSHLRVVGVDTLVSLGDLSSSEVDVQLGLAPKAPGVHSVLLVKEQSVLVARARHRFARKKLTKAELSELQHVRVDMVPGKVFRDPFAALFTRAGVRRDIVVTVPSFTTAAEVVAATDLVTMVPASFLALKGESLGFRGVESVLPTHTISISMCWHDRTHTDPAAVAFRALIREVLRPTPRPDV